MPGARVEEIIFPYSVVIIKNFILTKQFQSDMILISKEIISKSINVLQGGYTMEEKVLSKKRNGMAVLCGILLLYAASVVGIYFGAVNAYNAVILPAFS